MTTISLPLTLQDGDGFTWDIQSNGQINEGTSNAYDGGLGLDGFPTFGTGETEDNEREVAIGPATFGDIEVTRKIFVPPDRSWARFLEVVTNTGPTAATFTVALNSGLGSDDSTTVVGTSSGDAAFDLNDNWLITDDSDDGSGDPTLLHVIASAGGQRPAAASISGDNIAFNYDLTLQPGETKIVTHFASQNADRATALNQVQQFDSLNPTIFAGLSAQESGKIVNFVSEGLSINDVEVVEGNSGTTNVAFAVSRFGDTSQAASVNFSTADNTATQGSDYQPVSGTLTFNPGETSKTINVEVIGDDVGEKSESFFVNLTNPVNATIADDRGEAIVGNDDVVKVDSEVSLLVDISGSVDDNEYDLQLEGYANAFEVPNLFEKLISDGLYGQVAVNLVVWSSSDLQQELLPWTLIDGVPASQDFAAAIRQHLLSAGGSRPFSGSTDPGPAIDFAVEGFSNNNFNGLRQTIDVSGDGTGGSSGTATARDNALAAGVDVINGIVIGGESSVRNFYENNLIGGTNADGAPAFVLEASDFNAFSTAAENKLRIEFTPPPQVSVDDVTVVEGNAGDPTQLVFTASLNRENENPTFVDFATVNGTAVAGSDYTATNGTLTFAPFELAKTIAVEIIGDGTVERDETLSIQLSNVINGVIADPEGEGTIANDDEIRLVGNTNIEENSPTGTAIGELSAADPGSPATFTFSLADSAGGRFGVSDNQLQVNNGGLLDFEASPTYNVTVRATDAEANNFDRAFPINIGNLNEAPIIASPARFAMVENTTAAGAVTATDPESESPIYSLNGGVDAGLFTLDANTGALSFNAAPDYEAPGDADGDNSYNVQVQASDGTHAVLQDLEISVTDTQPPAFADAAFSIAEHRANDAIVGTLTATDPDGDAVAYSITNNVDGDGDGNGAFRVEGDLLLVNDSDDLDYETNADLSITVQASDGEATSDATITVNLSDFNATKPQIFWRDYTTPQNSVWYMEDGQNQALAELTALPDWTWRLMGMADFDKDQNMDLLWRKSTGSDVGSNAIWLMNDINIERGVSLPSLDGNWQQLGIGDFNGDGNPDILWRHIAEGTTKVWLMDGTSYVKELNIDFPTTEYALWNLRGTGDFNGDGISDLLWSDSETEKNKISLVGLADSGQLEIESNIELPGESDSNWEMKGVSDFNSDGKPDILWRNTATGENRTWLMDGTTRTGTVSLPTEANLNLEMPIHSFVGEGSPGSIEFTAASYQINEDGTAEVKVQVQRTQGGAGAVSAEVELTDGSAVAPEDYDGTAIPVSFADGEMSIKEVVIPVVDDLVVDPGETINLKLVSLTDGATLGGQSAATVEIVDNDSVLAFTAANYQINEDGSAEVAVTVQRTGGTVGEVSAEVQLTDDTAVAPEDYDDTTQTVTFADGETEKVLTIPIVDDIAVEESETINLVLVNPTGSATLGEQSTATVEIVDNDVASVLAFTAANYQVNEDGTAAAAVTVQRTGGTAGEVSAEVQLADDTAVAPDDYDGTAQTVTFADGETEKVLTIPIVDDIAVEESETINLVLVNPTGGATLGEQSTATVEIVDNDVASVLAFTAANYQINEDGSAEVAVTVQRSGGSEGEVSVEVQLTNGTAVAPDDYDGTAQTVTFADGETEKLVTIPVVDDAFVEGNEILNLALANPTGDATLGEQSSATVEIADNDIATNSSTIHINNVEVEEGDEGTTNAQFKVTLSEPSEQTITVNYFTADALARAGLDYKAAEGILTFAPGETEKVVDIAVMGDRVQESQQNFQVLLTDASNATISTPFGVGTIQYDKGDTTPESEVEGPVDTIIYGPLMLKRIGGDEFHLRTDGFYNTGTDFEIGLKPQAGEELKPLMSAIDGIVNGTNGNISVGMAKVLTEIKGTKGQLFYGEFNIEPGQTETSKIEASYIPQETPLAATPVHFGGTEVYLDKVVLVNPKGGATKDSYIGIDGGFILPEEALGVELKVPFDDSKDSQIQPRNSSSGSEDSDSETDSLNALQKIGSSIGIDIGADGVRISQREDIDYKLFGKVGITLKDLEATVLKPLPPDIPLGGLQFKGKAALDIFGKADVTIDFTEDNYFKILPEFAEFNIPSTQTTGYDFLNKHKLEIKGTFKVENIKFTDDWGIESATLFIDTPKKKMSISGGLKMPTFTAGAEVEFIDWKLNKVKVSGTDINKPIGSSGVFWQGIQASLENFSAEARKKGEPITISGDLQFTVGPSLGDKMEIPLWLAKGIYGEEKPEGIPEGIPEPWPPTEIQGALVTISGNAEYAHDKSLKLGGVLDVFGGLVNNNLEIIEDSKGNRVAGGLINGSVEATWNFKNSFQLKGQGTAFGVLDAEFGVSATKTNLLAYGNLKGKLPQPIADKIWFLGKAEIGEATLLLNAVKNEWSSDDYLALWAGINFLPTDPEIGFRYTFNPVDQNKNEKFNSFKKNFQLLGGEVVNSTYKPKTEDEYFEEHGKVEENPVQLKSSRKSLFTNISSLIIGPGTPWAVLTAEWENKAKNAPIQIKTPDGTILTEADIAKSDKIVIVDELSDSTQKTIALTAPEAGEWAIQLVKPDKLGKINFSALGGTNAPYIQLTSPAQKVKGPKVTIDYNAFDADSKANISLFYDTDKEGFDGIKIVDNLLEQDGKGSYTWNAKDLPTGNYHIYAMIQDDNSVPQFAYAPGSIQIVEPNAPNRVKNLKAKWLGEDEIQLQWSPVAKADYYRISYTDDLDSESYEQTIATDGKETKLTIPDLTPGHTYRFQVQAADGKERRGLASKPVELALGDAVENFQIKEDRKAQPLELPKVTGKVKIEAVPDSDKGEIQLPNGKAVSVGDSLTAQQLAKLKFVPKENAEGEAGSFSYTVNGGEKDETIQVVNLAIKPVKDPPKAGDDYATSDNGKPVTIPVLANDSDPDGYSLLEVTEVSKGEHGKAKINPDNSITYTPDAGFGDTDTITYTVKDSSGKTATAQVEIAVDLPVPLELEGDGDNNRLKGEDGDDILNGKAGNDKLIGAKGNDTLIGGGDKDILKGGKGNDTYQLNAKNASGSHIMDADGKDTLELKGTTIFRDGLVKGETGFARVLNGLVIDLDQNGKVNKQQDLTIHNFFATNKNEAGTGFIETVGDLKGNKILKALAGEPIPQIKKGNEKDNKLTGGAADDLLRGKEGSDTLNGKAGNDILNGGNGNDTLNGGGGKDILKGGKGDDTYQLNAKNAKGSRIIDADGKDTLELKGTTISPDGLAKGETGLARVLNNLVIDLNQDGKVNKQQDLTIHKFFASDKNEAGTGFIETVGDLKGNQILKALAGEPIPLIKKGDEKDNKLTGGAADDLLRGKEGSDTLNGKAGNDVLAGNEDPDNLKGGKGNDRIAGHEGNDTLGGGGGKDVLKGGEGNDTYQLNAKNASGSHIMDVDGKDILELEKADLSLDGLAKGETGFARKGESLIIDINQDGKANNQDLTIHKYFDGETGNKRGPGFIETVDGVKGQKILANSAPVKENKEDKNALKGGPKADDLKGKKADESLVGGNGNDTLNGGAGDDTLTGGKGRDSFLFTTKGKYSQEAMGEDTITDFIVGQKDKIVLDSNTFAKLDSKQDFSKQFATVTSDKAAATSDAYIVYNSNNGHLFYNANGNKPGLGSGGQFATLEGAPELDANDFNLV